MSLTCILLFALPAIFTISPNPINDCIKSYSPGGGLFWIDLLPDPDFESTPEIEIHGLSGEFSWTHDTDLEEDDYYIDLTWSHIPETELSIASGREYINDHTDFISFSQSFEWIYEFIPVDVIGSMEYSITTSGDFSENEEADEMFEVYWWIIDSSGNWDLIHYSYPPYSVGTKSDDVDLNYFSLSAGWHGMIENDEGEQEDPTDILTVAFGLAPTDSFRLYGTSEPWRTYSGNVSVRFYSASLSALVTTPSDPSETIQPDYNNSYNTPASEIFPFDAQVDDFSILDDIESMHLGSDNCVYTIGASMHTHSSPIYLSQVLVKWTPQTGVDWIQRYGNMTRGFSVAIDGDSIYTAGVIYQEDANSILLVVKYNSDGNIIWERRYHSEFNVLDPQIGVSFDGSIFVGFLSYDISIPVSFLELLKLNNEGEVLTNNLLPESRIHDLEVDLEGNVYVQSYGTLYKFDNNCSMLWDSSAWDLEDAVTAIDISTNGDLYTASITSVEETGGRFTTFRKWESLDSPSWSTIFNLDYGHGYQDWAECYNFAIAPDLSLFAIIEEPKFSDRFELIKLDSNGSLEWNRTIGDHTWSYPSHSYTYPIEIGSNGLLYISYTKYNDGMGSSFGLDAYRYTAFPFNFDNPQYILTLISQAITIGSFSVILIVLFLFGQDRRRNSHLVLE
ncbi:MAG: hypothetical protein ACFFED_12915 [Candidatus Thorarchaeota archaeon]